MHVTSSTVPNGVLASASRDDDVGGRHPARGPSSRLAGTPRARTWAQDPVAVDRRDRHRPADLRHPAVRRVRPGRHHRRQPARRLRSTTSSPSGPSSRPRCGPSPTPPATPSRAGVVRLCRGIAEAHGLQAEVVFEPMYPVTVNDAARTKFFANTTRALLGEGAVMPMPHPHTGSEDFSRVLAEVPGAMAFLGAATPAPTRPPRRPTTRPWPGSTKRCCRWAPRLRAAGDRPLATGAPAGPASGDRCPAGPGRHQGPGRRGWASGRPRPWGRTSCTTPTPSGASCAPPNSPTANGCSRSGPGWGR